MNPHNSVRKLIFCLGLSVLPVAASASITEALENSLSKATVPTQGIQLAAAGDSVDSLSQQVAAAQKLVDEKKAEEVKIKELIDLHLRRMESLKAAYKASIENPDPNNLTADDYQGLIDTAQSQYDTRKEQLITINRELAELSANLKQLTTELTAAKPVENKPTYEPVVSGIPVAKESLEKIATTDTSVAKPASQLINEAYLTYTNSAKACTNASAALKTAKTKLDNRKQALSAAKSKAAKSKQKTADRNALDKAASAFNQSLTAYQGLATKASRSCSQAKTDKVSYNGLIPRATEQLVNACNKLSKAKKPACISAAKAKWKKIS